MRFLFQELCGTAANRDDPVEVELFRRVVVRARDLQGCQPIKIPRCYLPACGEEIYSVELCGFGDASKDAYAAVVYIRVKTANTTSVRLVACKTLVALSAQQSIPRLELLPASIITRPDTSLPEAHRPVVAVNAMYFSLDSVTAVYLI